MRVCIVYSDGDTTGAFPEDIQGRDEAVNVIDVGEALRNLGHEVVTFVADDDLMDNLLRETGKIDVIFSIADEGYNLNPHLESNIVGMYELLGIPYTGGGSLSLGLCQNKPLTKHILLSHGLPTAAFAVFDKPVGELDGFNLRFPVIVKPSKEDGSVGIRQDSVVDDEQHLVAKINETLERYKQPVIVEEFIDGREINVGIVGNNDPLLLPLFEFIYELPEGVRNFMFYEAKWVEDSIYYQKTLPKCPADVSPELKAEIEDLARRAFSAVHLKGYGRVDFRVDKDGKPYIIEVNPNPDICKEAGLARMAEARDWSYEMLIARILDCALEKEQLNTTIRKNEY